MSFVTDLNDRERQKYAATFDKMSQTAADLAKALREGDDNGALVHLVLIALSGQTAVTELVTIFQKGTVATVPDHPPAL